MVKVDLICGLLGSGKTTLIKRMLDTVYAGKRIIVVENEYGQINLDAIALRKQQVDVKEITNGCVCCSMKLSFLEILEEIEQNEYIDRIVIEPSGMADIPEFITFCRSCKNIQLDRLIMVVNTKKIAKFLDIAGGLFFNQIRSVNTVFLNFADNLSAEQVDNARRRILEINPNAKVIEKNILSLEASDFPDSTPAVRSGSQKVEDKRMFIMMKSRGISAENVYQQMVCWDNQITSRQMDAFVRALDDVLCEDIYRIKGYIRWEQGISKIDYVAGDLFLEKTEDVDAPYVNRLVLIGRKHNVQWLERKIQSLFTPEP